MMEGYIEALPSIFVSMHSIYFIPNDDPVVPIIKINLLISVMSYSFNLYQAYQIQSD